MNNTFELSHFYRSMFRVTRTSVWIAPLLSAGGIAGITLWGFYLRPEDPPGLLYVFPILGMTWWFGVYAGVGTALVSAALWGATIWSTAMPAAFPSNASIGNVVLSTIVFMILVGGLSRLRMALLHRSDRRASAHNQPLHVGNDIVPICSTCKKIRDDEGVWRQLETYFQEHAAIQFTHGICSECASQLYEKYQARKRARN